MADVGPVVVAGATGFVGSNLCDRLVAEGVDVRRGTRSPDGRPGTGWVRLDLDDPDTLGPALEGARAVVHLVHHMGDDRGDLVARERRAGERMARAAAQAGVERIVYLGAPQAEGLDSDHLAARRATGEALGSTGLPVFELRASMIIGAGSASWRIVRDLAMRLPVMVLPAWLDSKTQPIALDDVLDALVRCLALPVAHAGVWDLPGPEVLSAKEILLRTSRLAGIAPRTLSIPVVTPSLSTMWLRLVTRADMRIAGRLVHGLAEDLVVDGDGLYTICPDLPRTPFDAAAAAALADPADAPGRRGQAVERGVQRVVGALGLRPRG